MADVPLLYNPSSRTVYTDIDQGQYNLTSGAPVISVGLGSTIPITDVDAEDLEILITFPFVQGSQNNTAMNFEIWSNKTLGDEQLMVSGLFTIGNGEQSLQTQTEIVRGSFLTAGSKLIEIYLGSESGGSQITNDFNAQAAVFRTRQYRDTLV